MRQPSLSIAQPGRWRANGQATQTDDVIDGWFSFETNVGRGVGHVQIKDGKCQTLFTCLKELKGFEVPSGERRKPEAAHGAQRTARAGWSGERRRTRSFC